MNSVILSAAAKVLTPLILIMSLILLYRGHHLPGGGFIGGLTAASAVLLHAFGRGAAASRRLFGSPARMMAYGLLVAGASALPGTWVKGTLFTGLWLPEFSLPVLGVVHLGTPLLFDVGVYLTVIGFVVYAARALDEDFTEDAVGGEDDSCN
jgi:multicomponent Na+:H+ antiporter subunit B